MNDAESSRFEFLGLKFHNYTLCQVIEKIEGFIKAKTPHMVFTPTAELIVRASEEEELRGVYNKADISTIDSYVVYYAAKIFGKPVKEPVSAARMMLSLLPVAQQKGYRIYLLGAREEVVAKAAEKINAEYPGINIVGWHNGYFDFARPEDVIRQVKEKTPDILFVALSSPLKENFITRNFAEMNIPVSVGVGGTFDIIAEKCRLAPAWISKIGMEWFYRLIQEPRRLWKRYLLTNTKFLYLLLKESVAPRR